MRATTAMRDLRAVAEVQAGLITSRQAQQAGLTIQQLARLGGDGTLERVRHGVYRICGSPPDEFLQLRAAWLAHSPTLGQAFASPATAVVSHRSAAMLHRLGDLVTADLEFTVPERRQARDPHIRFHRGSVPPAERALVEGLPVTSVARTVADLAEARLDGGHLAGVVRDAVFTHHVGVDVLTTVLSRVSGKYGKGRGEGQSLLTDFLASAGIPTSTVEAVALMSHASSGAP